MWWSLMIILASSACIYIYVLVRERSHQHKLPPGPSPTPIFGNFFQLGSKPNESLAELAKKYGPIMTIRLGHTLVVVVSSATMAKEVYQKNDQALAGRPSGEAIRVFDYDKLTMGWTPTGAHWRKIRMVCNTQIFSSKKLNADQGLRRQKSSIFSTDLIDISSDSGKELKNAVHGVIEEAGRPNLADHLPMLSLIDPQGVRRRITGHFKTLYAILDKLVDERIQSRASSKTFGQNDLLDVLLDHSQDHASEINSPHIKPQIMELLMAGGDTTSVSLEWIMAELVCNPNVMSKARSEIKDIVGLGREVEESDIARLPYLQAIIKETLRLHPTAPLLIPHKAETSVEIGGYTVPKNTQVSVTAWAIGRDPKIWEDPSSFQPERFLGSDVDVKGQDYDLIPFGSGRRICPGMPFALRTLHIILASLLHSFDWKLPDGMTPMDVNMDYKIGLNMQMVSPLLAIPIVE
ncbi:putative Cytochrome P450 [Cinnamomum micranthum f. kanehirae]|uniref:Putative Cytochrome P450 n=1 Tax=Cinnamomum micranthum f. kanehirae TaxID=337451 RepID=A0A3S3NEW4_9MAGN|nr:putative Cytochrome P450 [Cinnamomum micranthum f. kanehirae]